MHQGDNQVGAVNAVTIIRDAFGLAGRHAAVVFGASLVIQASVLVLSFVAMNALGMFGVLVWLLLTLCGAQLSVGVYTLLLLHLRHGHGVPSISYLIKEAAPLAPALCWLAFLSTLGIFIGMLFLLVPGVILALRWAVAAPALVARRVSATDALKISSGLTKGALGTVFALTLIMFFLVNGVPRLVGAGDPMMPIENTLIFQAVIAALATPVVAIATAELFLRLAGVPNLIVPGGAPAANGPYVPTGAPSAAPASQQPYAPGQAYAPAPAYHQPHAATPAPAYHQAHAAPAPAYHQPHAAAFAYQQPPVGGSAQAQAPAAHTYVQPPAQPYGAAPTHPAHQPYAAAPAPPVHQPYPAAPAPQPYPAAPAPQAHQSFIPNPAAPGPQADPAAPAPPARTESVAPPGMG